MKCSSSLKFFLATTNLQVKNIAVICSRSSKKKVVPWSWPTLPPMQLWVKERRVVEIGSEHPYHMLQCARCTNLAMPNKFSCKKRAFAKLPYVWVVLYIVFKHPYSTGHHTKQGCCDKMFPSDDYIAAMVDYWRAVILLVGQFGTSFLLTYVHMLPSSWYTIHMTIHLTIPYHVSLLKPYIWEHSS